LSLLGANKSLNPTPHLSFKPVVPQRGKTNGKSWNRDIWPRFTMARAFLLPKFPCTNRGLIYTEKKPLGRLYKMCYPFFFFMSSESIRQQMDSSSSVILLVYSPQRLYARGLTLIGVSLSLAGRERQWTRIFLVQDTLESRLLGQRSLSCKTLLIPATGSLEIALLT
jgi:hypothetical protein